MSKKGFTLIEIVCSIAILVIISLFLSQIYLSSTNVVAKMTHYKQKDYDLRLVAESIESADDTTYKLQETYQVTLKYKILTKEYEKNGVEQVISDEDEEITYKVFSFN